MPVPRSTEQLQSGRWEVICPQCGTEANPLPLSEEHVNPFNQYAVSKLAEERVALGLGWLYGIPTVALRYSITQGARQSLYNQYSGICRIFCSAALKGNPLTVYEDGCQSRDFIHIHDVVEANMLVLRRDEADFKAFNVGSGKATTVLEYAQAVRESVGTDVEIELLGAYRRGDNRHSVSSITRLQQLGWFPRHGLMQNLQDFLQWIDSIGGVPQDIPDALSKMQMSGVVCRAAAL
jgi:dTDP-L-rhamnose 4-epimerase